MGWERVTLRASALVSRHNSDKDRADDALWAEYIARVRAITEEARYEAITLDVDEVSE